MVTGNNQEQQFAYLVDDMSEVGIIKPVGQW